MDTDERVHKDGQQFPWAKESYLNIYDDLAFDHKQFDSHKHIYPTAAATDSKITLLKATDSAEADRS